MICVGSYRKNMNFNLYFYSTILIFFNCFTTGFCAAIPLSCPGSFQLSGSACFLLGSMNSWQNAEDDCTTNLAVSHLAYILNNADWTAFQNYRSTVSLDGAQVWLGCSKSGSDYVWPDGSTVSWKPTGTPTLTNQYCTSDAVANSFEWTTVSSGSLAYICMTRAMILIESVMIQATPLAAAVGNSISFTATVTPGTDSSMTFAWIFGDSNTASTTTATKMYSYTSAGTYTASVTVSNLVSGNISSNAIQINVYTPCVIASCSAPVVPTGTPTTFAVIVTSGYDCSLNLYPTGTAFPVKSGGQNSNTEATLWTSTIAYNYTTAGVYTAIVSVYNNISSSNTTCTVNVQDDIDNLTQSSPTTFQYYPYNTPVILKFQVNKGTNIAITGSIDTNTVTGYWQGTKGNLTITANDMNGVGPKTVSAIVSNLLSTNNTLQYSYQVEYPFMNFQTTPSGVYLNTTVTVLKLSWANASHFNCIVRHSAYSTFDSTYDWSTRFIQNYDQSVDVDLSPYTEIGSYTIYVNCSNHLGSFYTQLPVTVQYPIPINCITFKTEYVGNLSTAAGSSARAIFSIYWTCNLPTPNWPTAATIDFDFMESTGSKILNVPYTYNMTNITQDWNYTISDSYQINITVKNLVSSVSYTPVIDIVVDLANITFDMLKFHPPTGRELHYYYLQTDEVAKFTVTLSAGTLFNLTIRFNDQMPPFVKYSKNNNSLSTNHSFSKPGLYNVTAFVQNYARTTFLQLPIPLQPFYVVVIDPVQCANFTLLDGPEPVIKYQSNGSYYRISISPNSSCDTIGTNVRYTINWGDIIESGNLTNSTGDNIIWHLYNATKIYKIDVIVWNEISSLNFSTTIHVYNEVTGVTIITTWINTNNSNSLVPGYHGSGSPAENRAYFDIDYPVRFASNILWGSDVLYSWTFSDGYSAVTNATYIDRNFTKIGPVDVTLNVKNKPSGKTFSYTAIIERATKNPNITDNSPFPMKQKPYQQYVITMDIVGTDSCYYLNFNDSAADGKQYIMYGNKAMCLEFFPNYDITGSNFNILETADLVDSPVFDNDTTELDATGTVGGIAYINLTRKFNVLGLHRVNFTVVNHVYKKTFNYPTVVTKGWCKFPVINIRDVNKCQSSDSCKCFFNTDTFCHNPEDVEMGDRVAYMKDKILLDAEVSIDCPSSANIWFGWSVQELNLSYPGGEIKDVTYMIEKLNYRSFTAKILIIPSNYMPGARYRFRLTVWPDYEIDMERWDETNIYLQASYLEAEFVGGMAARHVPYKQQVTFDGWTESYDPDFSKTNKTGLQFAFYCRRACETWPTPSVNYTFSNYAAYSSASCTLDDGVEKGCFKAYNSGPMALTGTGANGEWAVDNTYPGIITINTNAVNPKVWYALMLLVSKSGDTRVSYKEIFFYASTSIIPNVTMKCATNCQKSYARSLVALNSGRYYNRVNPTSRVSIEAIIDGFKMSEKYIYQWDLFSREASKDNNTFLMNNSTIINHTIWSSYATTGVNLRTISLKTGWWKTTSNNPGFYLRLTIWVGTNTSGIVGQYFYEIFLNDPPKNCSNCNCTVNTQYGLSLSPTYGITCDNFQDTNNAELYYFVKQKETANADFWLDIGCSKKSLMPDKTVYVKPVPGPENGTIPYQAQFKIRIIDSSGSYIDVTTAGVVYSFDKDYGYGNPVWSILNYTTNCDTCLEENFYLQLTKVQQCYEIANVVRTFSSLLNLNPSTGCLPAICDNETAIATNCTIGEEIEIINTDYEPVPTNLINVTQKILGNDWATLSPCKLDLQLRQHIRQQLLDTFADLKIPYFSQFAVVLSAMYPATLIPAENTIEIVRNVEQALQEGVAHLDGVDPQMDIILEADVREEACKIITGIVSNMEQTTNYYGAIWRDKIRRAYPSFTMEGLKVDIALYDQMFTNNVTVYATNFTFNNSYPMWDLGNQTLDADVAADIQETRFNIIQITVLLTKIRGLKGNVTDYIQARKVMGEAPSVITTSNITAVYHKSPVKNMTSFRMPGVGGCQFMTGSAAEMFGDLNSLEETVMGSVECAVNNPFTTDKTAIGLKGTVYLSFQNSTGTISINNLTKPIDTFVPRSFDRSQLLPIWNTTESFSKPMTVYSFNLPQYLGFSFLVYEGWIDVPENQTILNDTELNPSTSTTTKSLKLTTQTNDLNSTNDDLLTNNGGYSPSNVQQFAIFVKFWTMFDLDNKYDYYCVVPKWDELTFNSTANPTAGDPRTCTVSWDLALASAKKTDDTEGVKDIGVYVAVQSIPYKYTIASFKNTTKIPDFNDKNFLPINYTLYPILATCVYYDDTLKIWKGEGTEVGPNTTKDVTHCRVSHLTAFSSGFSVPTNSLNLQANAFLHLAENPIAFVFCLCLFCLYLIMFVWCRRKDKEDLKKAGIAPLPDNDPRDRYLYEIVFYTGTRPNAGTSAKVFFQLTGDRMETDVRLAQDAQRKAFHRNGIDTFIMAVPVSLGKLTYLRIWHDNSGPSPAWYFSRMQIMDVQTGEQYFFVVNNWLAVEEADGQVERIVPVAGKGDLTDFSQLFWQKSNKNLFDGHIWFSVFRRPPRSHFTRVQRLTCCLSLIYCTMVANILFYKTTTIQANDIILSVGPIVITWTSLKTGIIAALIVAPVNTVLVLLFRYAKPIPIKSPMQDYMEKQKQREKEEKLAKSKKSKTDKSNKENQDGVDAGDPVKNQINDESNNSTEINAEVTKTGDEIELKNLNQTELYNANKKVKVEEPPKIVHIDTRVPKKKFWLPHRVIYIGYALAFATVAVAFWLIVNIAFGFGRKKALDWVIAMFVSLIQSIVFIQPVKIIAMAIVYSVLCKKPEKDEYEPSEIELREDEVYLHDDQATIEDMKNSSKRLMILQKLQRTRRALPPDMQLLQNARELKHAQ